MSDNQIMLCVVLAAVAVIGALFIRRAIRHRKAIGASVPEEEIEIKVQPDSPSTDNIYFLRYILSYKAPFKSSKTVRIRPEYVDAIRDVCRIIGGGKTTVTAYVDKVLEVHFAEYLDAIERLYREKHGKTDNSGE